MNFQSVSSLAFEMEEVLLGGRSEVVRGSAKDFRKGMGLGKGGGLSSPPPP